MSPAPFVSREGWLAASAAFGGAQARPMATREGALHGHQPTLRGCRGVPRFFGRIANIPWGASPLPPTRNRVAISDCWELGVFARSVILAVLTRSRGYGIMLPADSKTRVSAFEIAPGSPRRSLCGAARVFFITSGMDGLPAGRANACRGETGWHGQRLSAADGHDGL